MNIFIDKILGRKETYEDGMKAFIAGDYKKAIPIIEKSAESGNVNALFNLGVFYENGQGVEEDVSKAIHYYQKAADQGDMEAKHNLTVLVEKTMENSPYRLKMRTFDEILMDYMAASPGVSVDDATDDILRQMKNYSEGK